MAFVSKNLIYICFGMPRSGSTFAFQLTVSAVDALKAEGYYLNVSTKEILKSIGISFEGDGYIHNYSDLERAVELLLCKSNGGLPFAVVLKTHAQCSRALAMLLASKQVYASAVYREPLGVAKSLINVSSIETKNNSNRFTKYLSILDTVDGIQMSVTALYSWVKNPQVLSISFAKLISNPEAYLSAFCAQLGCQIDTNYISSWYNEDKVGRVGEYSINKEVQFSLETTELDVFNFNREFSQYYAWIDSVESLES